MIKNFIIYDQNGAILRTGSCPAHALNIQANTDENIMEGSADSKIHMIVNEKIVDKPIASPSSKSLDELKLDKSNAINSTCRNAIYAGYQSQALGELTLYPSRDKDQTNMVASVTDSLNPANGDDWVTPFWCADANGNWTYRLHTKAQIQKAGADGKAHIVAQLTKNAQLQAQIQAATTEEELNLIVW